MLRPLTHSLITVPIPKPTPELIEQWLAEPEYRTPGRGQLVTLTADRLGKIINQAAQWGYVQCNAEYERAAMDLVPIPED